MSLKDADEEEMMIANKLKDMGKGGMSVEKICFLKNAVLLLNGREKILNNFKSNIFRTKNHESEPELEPKSGPISAKLKNLSKKNTRDERNINTEIFSKCFKL